MAGMSLRLCLAAATLLGSAALAAAAAPLAQSAQLSIAGSVSEKGLALSVSPATPGAALSVSAVSVTLEGRTLEGARQGDGSWLVPLPAARAGGDTRLELAVAHDGIRESLSGQLPAALPASGGAGWLGAHKQMAWWILNIGVVLIAALAISRRRSS